MSKRVLCKFFAHGACLKGEHCEFSHDWKDPPNNICTYYQKGICSYGSRCRYEHVKPLRSDSASSSSTVSYQSLASTSIPLVHSVRTGSSRLTSVHNASGELSASRNPFFPPSNPAWNLDSGPNNLLENGEIIEPRNVKPEDHPLCSFAAAGNCPRGDKCPHVHGDLCPTCGKNCLHPFRPEEREEHLRTCEKKQKHLEALKHSQEIECSVCLDRVLSKPTAAERKFGLLSECDHPFCISCIRNWRSSSPTSGMDVNTALRACPICRKLSYFVVPSVIWYSSKEEKQEIVDSYKAKLSSIDCKHFDFGNGNCPFGTSCFYKHTVKRGSYTWKYHRPPPRRPRPCRSSAVDDMNAFFDVFEHFIGEDEYEIYDAEDYFDEDYFDEDDIDDMACIPRWPFGGSCSASSWG
ncbi:E3 ubiquitin-protein ligase makorin isoform X2 [Ricinus communis]|uniref:E3 ubiquitin-protein ligase makorin isoform X2 n=1 Tax=Ricinus communis TaxID=3988 RepID=UPI0007724F0D|nr:E3 ubiquitin-protein ligase makorin isoform X2 [Ricinus communis]|eukprot:XP_015579407.1 E3 ubiquitin-protein ligase makorin isoform X2 [Ricinus communis]